MDRGEPRLGLALVIGLRVGVDVALVEGKEKGKGAEAEGVEIF